MSGDHLRRLYEQNAFEAGPARYDLHELHVPFDHLVGGGGGPGPWEGRLHGALSSGQRVYVTGASGEGKSSLMQYALGPLVEGLAPLPVALGLEDPRIVTEPGSFAAHLITRVRHFIDLSLPKVAGSAATGRGSTGLRLTFPAWFGSDVELTRELASVTDVPRSSAADHIEVAQQLLQVIDAAGLRPVLLLDDTDKWLRGERGEGEEELFDAFFRKIVRLLAEDLGCGAVIAVHPSYQDGDAYRAAAGFIGTVVEVPRLPHSAALGTVLRHREAVALEAHAEQMSAWSVGATDSLFARYSSGSSLRDALNLARTSLAGAVSQGAEVIEPLHVDWAERELRP